MISDIDVAKGSLCATEGYPIELQQYRQWLLFELVWNAKAGKYNKIPKRNLNGQLQGASKTNQEHYMTFDEALNSVKLGIGSGIGFCITDQDPFVCIDLDKCIEEQWAQDVIQQFDSATELSVSQTGAHIFIKASKPEAMGTKSKLFHDSKVELLGNRTFVALTGRYNGKPIAARQSIFESFGKPLIRTQTTIKPPMPRTCSQETTEIIKQLSENPRLGGLFNKLFYGEGTCDDKSADDLTLCSLIACAVYDDPDKIDEVFRLSKRYRDKWEREDYRVKTIARASGDQNLFRGKFSPKGRFKSVDTSVRTSPPPVPTIPPIFPQVNAPMQNDDSLRKFSIRGQSKELEEQAATDVFILEELALKGQMTVFSAPPNAGKTLITLSLLTSSIDSGNINPDCVYYVNADDNAKGTRIKNRIAEKLGFHMIAPGLNDFRCDDLLPNLKKYVDSKTASDKVVILDTVKKFADLMNKTSMREFTNEVRPFVQAGGTAILLSHVNKHKGADGKHVYAGTSDLLDDSDCFYTLSVVKESGDTKTVEFENNKNRGDVANSRKFSYSIKKGISYQQLLDSVSCVSEKEEREQAERDMLIKDWPIIEAIRKMILRAKCKRTEVISLVHSNHNDTHSRRDIESVLDKYTDTHWSIEKGAKNSKLYSLIVEEY